jgi:hypothetical protein
MEIVLAISLSISIYLHVIELPRFLKQLGGSMNHISDKHLVTNLNEELLRILTPLSERLAVDLEEGREIAKDVEERFKKWLTAIQAIEEKYQQLNGAPGNPRSGVKMGKGGGFYRQYEAGAIYFHPETGPHRVYGAIYEKYLQLNAERSFLGYPTTDEMGTPDGRGKFNHFQGGSIYWTPDTGAREVHGAIRAKWEALGWERSFLGYPVTDETITLDGIGRFNHFQGGSIFWTSDTGAWEVHGKIRAKWEALGWERSYLGYPTSDEKDWTIGQSPDVHRISRFQRGTIVMYKHDTRAIDLPDTVILKSGPLNPPEGITGWVELMMNSAGFFSYKGSLHNSTFTGLHVAVASAPLFKANDGGVLVASEETHLGGTTSFEEWEGLFDTDRDHVWEKVGFDQRIRDNWDDLQLRGMTTTLKVNATVGDVVEAVLVGIPVAIVVGLAAFAVYLIASGKAQVCRGHHSMSRNPQTGEESPSFSFPICTNDPNIPNHDCCKDYK